MTNRTTDQWEALLDGTTPGPWVIGATLKDPLLDVSAGTCEDAKLICAATEAVAEVVRLRQLIAGHKRVWLRVAEKISARGDEETAWLVKVMALQLGDILEGDTDE